MPLYLFVNFSESNFMKIHAQIYTVISIGTLQGCRLDQQITEVSYLNYMVVLTDM